MHGSKWHARAADCRTGRKSIRFLLKMCVRFDNAEAFMRARYCREPAAIAALACLALASPARAESVADFYRAHPVNLLIGFPVANAYDTYGRAVARHLGKRVPGNPTVIAVNR